MVKTSRQLTVWKKTFRDAEKTAVTKKEPMKRRIIFLIHDVSAKHERGGRTEFSAPALFVAKTKCR